MTIKTRTDATDQPVDLDDIGAAALRIADFVSATPILTFPQLDVDLNTEVFIKAELFHPTGAYKIRGATNAILGLSADGQERGVLAHSSGNHGIALACAAQRHHVRCTVVVPDGTDSLKIRELVRYGAIIIYCPNGMREQFAAAELDRNGAVFIHPYENPAVIAGHGTAALELFEQVTDIDIVITPIGGGSLLSSTAIVAAAQQFPTRCIGAEPLAVDDSHRSLATGIRQPAVENPSTIAQAVLGGIGERSFEVISRLGAEVMTVTEDEIINASRFFIEALKLVVEPSAATVLALARKLPTEGKRVALVVSGGNTDLAWYR